MSDKEITELWMQGCTAPEIAYGLEIPEREVQYAIMRFVNAQHEMEKDAQQTLDL